MTFEDFECRSCGTFDPVCEWCWNCEDCCDCPNEEG